MSENSPANQPAEGTISLQAISQNMLLGLQRQYDMLVFTLASIRNEDPTTYNLYSSLARVMPLAPAHLPHDKMRAYSRALLQRSTVNDLIVLSVECMNHCHLLCTFIKERGKNMQGDAASDQRISERQIAFAKANIQEKFSILERDFNIVCELEDSLFSLAAALRVLVNNHGQVTNDDISPDGTLVLEFKAVKDVEENGKTTPKLVDTSRSFKPGERLELSDEELIGMNITVAKFFDGLFRSVDFFGTNHLGTKE